MKCCIITNFNHKYAPIADVTLPLMKLYADKWGYNLEIGLYEEDPAKPLKWGDRGKWALYSSWRKSFDVIMWLDVDVLIMNHDITIEERSRAPFVWSYDHNGPCSGWWIARTTANIEVMASKIRNEGSVGRSCVTSTQQYPARTVLQFEPNGRSDQDVMRDLMTMPPYSHLLKNCISLKEAGHCFDFRAMDLPREYDYLGNYEPGDWLYTVPSLPLDVRLKLLAAKALEFYDSLDSSDPRIGHHRAHAAAICAPSQPAAADSWMQFYRRGRTNPEPALNA